MKQDIDPLECDGAEAQEEPVLDEELGDYVERLLDAQEGEDVALPGRRWLT